MQRLKVRNMQFNMTKNKNQERCSFDRSFLAVPTIANQSLPINACCRIGRTDALSISVTNPSIQSIGSV